MTSGTCPWAENLKKWTNEIAKLQISTKSKNSSTDCKKFSREWKCATGSRK